MLGFAEGVRADMGALKGILIALAGFTDEARTSIDACPAPVDLIDGEQLLEMVRDNLSPAVAELAAGYRGFGPRPRGAAKRAAAGREDREDDREGDETGDEAEMASADREEG